MSRTVVTSSEAPPAGAPFSPGLEVDGWVFLAGQGGFDPATGQLGNTIEEQTEQTLRNVRALLRAAGCELRDVVSCLCHLADTADFPGFNTVYERWFDEPRPVRTTVGAALVRGMIVEITVVARKPG